MAALAVFGRYLKGGISKVLAPNFFRDPEFPDYMPEAAEKGYLSEPAMIELLDKGTVDDVDIVLFDPRTGRIGLTERSIYPMKGLWIIGGKRIRGERPRECAVRKLKDETGADIDSRRLRRVSVGDNYIWRHRKQPGEGSHNVATTYAFAPTPEEAAYIAGHLTPKEYNVEAGIQWFTLPQLIERRVHPLILKLYVSIFDHEAMFAAGQGKALYKHSILQDWFVQASEQETDVFPADLYDYLDRNRSAAVRQH